MVWNDHQTAMVMIRDILMYMVSNGRNNGPIYSMQSPQQVQQTWRDYLVAIHKSCSKDTETNLPNLVVNCTRYVRTTLLTMPILELYFPK